MRTSTRFAAGGVLTALVTLAAGGIQKAPCGSSLKSSFCYSDVVSLWSSRDLGSHALPYVHGGVSVLHGSGGATSATLTGHELEYPALTGVFVWLTSLPAHSSAAFLALTVAGLLPFALLIVWLLSRMAGPRVLLFAAAPTLAWYAFYNWDLLVVAATVAAIYAWYRRRMWLAGVLLGAGACVKMWPLFLLAPLAMELATRRRWRELWGSLVSAAAVVLLVNVPFMVLNFGGWKAPFTFQQLRSADITTNSLWPYLVPSAATDVSLVNGLSEVAWALGFCAVLAWALRRWKDEAVFPFVQSCAAMVAVFIVFGKVHSPQYALWMLPFLVLLRLRPAWWIAFVASDLWLYLQWSLLRVFGRPLEGAVLLADVVLMGLAVAAMRSDPAFGLAPLAPEITWDPQPVLAPA